MIDTSKFLKNFRNKDQKKEEQINSDVWREIESEKENCKIK